MDTVKVVSDYIKDQDLLKRGDRVCLAVSGGADSVAMLLIFLSIRTSLDLELSVCHIEHGIRGEDSLADAEFVEKLCKKHGIFAEVVHVNALSFAKENGLTVEEAARDLRYKAFSETNASIIATAHNGDDNAETFLFNLVRGSGLAGLCGISKKRSHKDKTIIRPLLCLSRKDIEEYLNQNHQEYCTDKTNLDTVYSRNKIRHNIIPGLSEINSGAISHINNTANIIFDLYEEKRTEAKKILDRCSNDKGLETDILTKIASPLKEILLLEWLTVQIGSVKDVGANHIKAIADLAFSKGPKGVDIPGVRVVNSYGFLKIQETDSGRENENPGLTVNKSEILPEKAQVLSFSDKQLEIRLLKDFKTELIPKDCYTKWVDYGKIENILEVRYPREGDYFTINKDGAKKPYNRFCIDNKIPREERAKKVLVTDGSHIIWALGYRISENYKVDTDTELVLQFSIRN